MSERDDSEATSEEATRLRRGFLGYRRADVDSALRDRDDLAADLEDELDARDAELAELRQDIAALWMAFAQHDRMIRDMSQAPAAAADPIPAAPDPAGAGGTATAPVVEPDPVPAPAPEPAPASVSDQLSELDEVLAAIEMATQTLEQTYAEEIAEADPLPAPGEAESSPVDDEAEADGQEADSEDADERP